MTQQEVRLFDLEQISKERDLTAPEKTEMELLTVFVKSLKKNK